MAPSDELRGHIAGLRRLTDGIRPDQMSNATPCAKWTVRDLCNHFVGGAQMFASAFRGDEVAIDPDAPTPDLLGSDPARAFDDAVAAFVSAVDSPGAMDRTINLPFGQLPAPVTLAIIARPGLRRNVLAPLTHAAKAAGTVRQQRGFMACL